MRRCLAGVVLALTACSSSSPAPGSESPAQTQTPAGPAASVAGASGPAKGSAGSKAASSPSAGATATLAVQGAAANGGAATASGASGSAAATGTAGTVGAAPGSSSTKSRDVGNFFESGAWHGYVFVTAQGMGTTISPMDFSMQTTGMPRCVKGSVAASTDYSAVAQLGFELTDSGGVTPTKAGIQIQVTNTGASPLRFQIESPDGATRWCAPLTGTGGFIPWASLKTECWGATGKAYSNEPVAKAMVLVPGDKSAAVPFDFCVNALAEADGAAVAAGAAGSGAAMMTSGSAGSGATGMMSAMSSSGGSTTAPPIQGGCDGYATGYWDCCKPHCGWKDNIPGGNPLGACDKSDNPIGDVNARNACEGGPAHMCHTFVPWAVNDKLAYGYAAVSARAGADICGKCYQLQFLNTSFNAGEDPGSAAIGGKTMIVQATNIGSDVENGQFDISIPGRGVGMYDACSSQWGVPKAELGETYGGFLPVCKKQVGRTDHAAIKSCVMQSCMNVFEARGLKELAAGCQFFVDWFEVADNPKLKYKEVACPAELSGKGIMRSSQPTNACLK